MTLDTSTHCSMTKDLAHNINRYQYIILFVCVGVMYSGKYDVSDVTMSRGGKNRRAREHCLQEMLNSCRKFI